MRTDPSPTPSDRPPTTRRGPGRPARGTSPLDRNQLLAVSARAFATGYASTSVRAIARELGVSQAAVQHHAPTKDALLRAVIDGFMVPRLAAARRQLDVLDPDDGDPAESLRRMIRWRIGTLAEHAGLVVAILADTSPGADGRREHLLARLLPAADAGMRSLRGLEQRGAVRPVDPSTLTAIAMLALPAAATSWHHLAVTGVPQRSFEEFLDAFSDLLTYGLLPR